jgi:hypothetical protein
MVMRLEPLYRIRFTYPESWAVGLAGGWQPARPDPIWSSTWPS